MPSIKNPVQIRLDDRRHDLLKRLAKLQGVSMASVLSELFEAALPTLERVVVFAESAERLSKDARLEVASKVESAAKAVLPKLGDAMRQGDIFLGEVEASLPSTQGRRPAASGRPPRRSGYKGKSVKRARAK